MVKVWLFYTMLMGYPVVLPDSPTFENETACIIALGSHRLEQVKETFKLECRATMKMEDE